ncbi:hypothetical protein LEP1GSC085_2321 [Leptospira interrogans str. L0996]|nr:hypothetical protein LEP1GSC085_2321 [Leptospira interrogans str. L0996]
MTSSHNNLLQNFQEYPDLATIRYIPMDDLNKFKNFLEKNI